MRLGLDADRLLPIDPATRAVARRLYEAVADAPILSPHGHVDPRLLLDDQPFSDPVELLVRHDHYVTRLLHANGVPLEQLGLDPADPRDPRDVWRLFCGLWHRFAGTASGYWLSSILVEQLGIDEQPELANADGLYDTISRALARPEFRPRALVERFGIEVLATTDDPLDPLTTHQALAADPEFRARVIPTFRPDAFLDPEATGFGERIDRLGASTFAAYLGALEGRRRHFLDHGAVSADHGVLDPFTGELDDGEAARIFDAARAGTITPAEARAFRGRMLIEMARMSVDDGLVMTIHAGVLRNHHHPTFDRFGPDTGHDLPVATEWVRNLRPLLERFGTDPRLHLILFTVDETTASRELAPLAGFYPSVFLGAPWWFLDAPDAALRFRAATTETAGLYRGSGFVDDTRAFLSIPARHDMARRLDAAFLARLVGEGRLDEQSALRAAHDLVDLIPPDGVEAVSAPSTRLSRAALGLDAPPVRIVHLGLGAFHRSHQAWYTEHADDRADWGIAGFTVRSPATAERLAAQDGLYSLIERGPETDQVSVVGSLVEARDGASSRFDDLVAAPTTAVVTLTITEAGYRLDGAEPPVALTRLARALAGRRRAGAPPITIVSCDNLPGNAEVTRRALQHLDPELDDSVSFVSTSVDRITPRLAPIELAELRTASGWDDDAPVVTEPFTDWVLEGAFPAGRPQWEGAGARFVHDVAPFERRKLWLLNGAHTILASSGAPRGHQTVAAAIADPACLALVEDFWREAAHHLNEPGLEIGGYRAELLLRFANPRIAHRLLDIADQAPTKVRVRLLPVLRAELAAGRSGAATLAALADDPGLLAILKEEST